MKELIRFIVVNSAIIVGINFATKEDQILGPLGNEIRKLHPNINKPLTECPPCMASVWGTMFYSLFYRDRPMRKLLLWPFYVCALSGWVRLLNLTVDAVRKEAEKASDDD